MNKLVVLFSGKMQCGKNQLADFMRQQFEKENKTVCLDMCASDVKKGCQEDFKNLTTVLHTLADEIDRNLESEVNADFVHSFTDQLRISNDNWYEQKTPITRAILQAYGTDIFRKRVDDFWWVNLLKKRLSESLADVILVTDCRFPNELEGLFPENGEYTIITIRVQRNSISKIGMEHSHPSETALDTYPGFDYIVENSGGLGDLRDSAEAIIENIKNNY